MVQAQKFCTIVSSSSSMGNSARSARASGGRKWDKLKSFGPFLALVVCVSLGKARAPRARVVEECGTSSKILAHRNFGISRSARFARSAPKT